MRCFHTSATTHVSLPLMSQEQQSSDSPWWKAAGHKEPSRGSDTWGTGIQITNTRAHWWTRNTRNKLKAKAVLLTLGQDQVSPLWAWHASLPLCWVLLQEAGGAPVPTLQSLRPSWMQSTWSRVSGCSSGWDPLTSDMAQKDSSAESDPTWKHQGDFTLCSEHSSTAHQSAST